MLTRSGRVNNPEALRIVFCNFHPGITFTVNIKIEFLLKIKYFTINLLGFATLFNGWL